MIPKTPMRIIDGSKSLNGIVPTMKTYPLHIEQITFRVTDVFFDVPLYNSSKETFNTRTTTTSFPVLLGLLAKGQNPNGPALPPFVPSLRASSPYES